METLDIMRFGVALSELLTDFEGKPQLAAFLSTLKEAHLNVDLLRREAPMVNITPEILAQLYHEAFDRQGPSYYRAAWERCGLPWNEVPEPNKQRMIQVSSEILKAIYPVNVLCTFMEWILSTNEMPTPNRYPVEWFAEAMGLFCAKNGWTFDAQRFVAQTLNKREEVKKSNG